MKHEIEFLLENSPVMEEVGVDPIEDIIVSGAPNAPSNQCSDFLMKLNLELLLDCSDNKMNRGKRGIVWTEVSPIGNCKWT